VTGHNADGSGVATSVQTAVVDPARAAGQQRPAGGHRAPPRSGLDADLLHDRHVDRHDADDLRAAVDALRPAGGGSCTADRGAPSARPTSSRTPTIGATLRVAVTATNSSASATVSSAPSAAVGPKVAPQKTADPAIGGTAIDGLILTATDGAWSGTATIATTRRWQRCVPLGPCADLGPRRRRRTLTLSSADVGSAIRTPRHTASNPDGTTHRRPPP